MSDRDLSRIFETDVPTERDSERNITRAGRSDETGVNIIYIDN